MIRIICRNVRKEVTDFYGFGASFYFMEMVNTGKVATDRTACKSRNKSRKRNLFDKEIAVAISPSGAIAAAVFFVFIFFNSKLIFTAQSNRC